MNCSSIIYLLSLALQVSGALILIFYYYGNTERRILNAIYLANSEVHRKEDNTVIVEKNKLVKAHKEIILNRIAFIFIGIGYLASLFGSNEGICPWIGLMILVIASLALMAISIWMAKLIATAHNRQDKKYSFEDLKSKIDGDVITNMTKSEIDKICV